MQHKGWRTAIAVVVVGLDMQFALDCSRLLSQHEGQVHLVYAVVWLPVVPPELLLRPRGL